MVPQTPDAPLTHGHRVVTTTLTHNVNQLRRRHDVRLDFVPRLRPLLVRIRIPDQTGFAPGYAEEAESESVFRTAVNKDGRASRSMQ